MSWNEREEPEGGSLINIGPDPKKNKQRFTGLLLGFRRHAKHPDRERVWALDKDGREIDIVGNVAILQQLGPEDIGKLIDLEYQGEEKVAGGNTKKKIAVRVWEGEWTDKMQKWSPACWTRAIELEGERKQAAEKPAPADDGPPPADEDPFAGDEGDDGLPF